MIEDLKKMSKADLESHKKAFEGELREREAVEKKVRYENCRLFWKKVSDIPLDVVDTLVPSHSLADCQGAGISSIHSGRSSPKCTRCLLLEVKSGYAATPEELAELDAKLVIEIRTKVVS